MIEQLSFDETNSLDETSETQLNWTTQRKATQTIHSRCRLGHCSRSSVLPQLNDVLADAGFDQLLEKKCAPCYKEGGRPGIPRGVYFRTLFIGYERRFRRVACESGIDSNSKVVLIVSCQCDSRNGALRFGLEKSFAHHFRRPCWRTFVCSPWAASCSTHRRPGPIRLKWS